MRWLLASALLLLGISGPAQAQFGGGGGSSVSAPRTNAELQAGCEAGKAKDCGDLGQRYFTGSNTTPKNDKTAAALFQRACDGGDAFGCMKLAFAYSEGLGVKADDARAAKLAERGCNGGSARACAFLGAVYAQGGGGYPKDVRRAEELLRQACFPIDSFDYAPGPASRLACPALAKLTGEPACSSLAVTERTIRKNCYVGERAWQETIIAAPAPQVDPAVAANAAITTGNAAYGRKDFATALAQFAVACDTGNAEACGAVGYMYIQGEGVQASGARAAAPLATACDGGIAIACGRLGLLYDKGSGVGVNKARAFALFNGACARSDMPSCYNLGRLYESGQGTATDTAQAAALYQRACTAGMADGCSSIGMMYANGLHFARSEAQAETFFKSACSKGSNEGCQRLASIADNRKRQQEIAIASAAQRKSAQVVRRSAPPSRSRANAIDCLKMEVLRPASLYQRRNAIQCDEAGYCTKVDESPDENLYYTLGGLFGRSPGINNICSRPIKVDVRYDNEQLTRNYGSPVSLPNESFVIVANEQGRRTTYKNPIIVAARWAD